jgi:hypothetical protein
MKTRKLLAEHVLADAARLNRLGVPIRKIIRDKNLVISSPHFVKLLKWYNMISPDMSTVGQILISESLFPEWVNQTLHCAQEQPPEYTYDGHFPQGHWSKVA